MKEIFYIMGYKFLDGYNTDRIYTKVEKELYLTIDELIEMYNILDYQYEDLMDGGIITIKYNNELVDIVYPKSENLYEGWNKSSGSSLISLKTAIRNYNISKL